MLSSLLSFVVFQLLFLGTCGKTCWFSPLMHFIFDLCLCGLVDCSRMRQESQMTCTLGMIDLFCCQQGESVIPSASVITTLPSLFRGGQCPSSAHLGMTLIYAGA